MSRKWSLRDFHTGCLEILLRRFWYRLGRRQCRRRLTSAWIDVHFGHHYGRPHLGGNCTSPDVMNYSWKNVERLVPLVGKSTTCSTPHWDGMAIKAEDKSREYWLDNTEVWPVNICKIKVSIDPEITFLCSTRSLDSYLGFCWGDGKRMWQWGIFFTPINSALELMRMSEDATSLHGVML